MPKNTTSKISEDMTPDLSKNVSPRMSENTELETSKGTKLEVPNNNTVSEVLNTTTPETPSETLPKTSNAIAPKTPEDAVSKASEDMAPEMDKQPEDRKPDEKHGIRGTIEAISSHGTFVYERASDRRGGHEGLERYEKGGYHPVHLGDELGESGRYRVIHKLGLGTFGTVWLCLDNRGECRYVAVKIMVSDVCSERSRNQADFKLKDIDRSTPVADLIAFPLDDFVIKGPNGAHHCIVLPFLGPRVSPGLWVQFDHPTAALRSLCQQAAQALQFLHKNDWCHGDFRPANIVVRIKDLNHLGEDELVSILGKPETRKVNVNLIRVLPSKYLTDRLCLIDFGESYLSSSQSPAMRIPFKYRPPEHLMDDENPVSSPNSDIWALGCTLFEIRQQEWLVEDSCESTTVLKSMVTRLGKLPDHLWGKWEDRARFFDQGGNRLNEESDDEDETLESMLSEKSYGAGKKELFTCEKEQKVFADLLRKLLRYESGERLTIDEALEYEWFKMDVDA
ncbi:SRSF protein kinase 2 [Cladobotryum mycophilum]|uniref:SRSF protein kinase 2 n=1 Tax=Cladobotryum mycophilum TaxID=491253 RepID=A0ABR0T1W7_9HYPO